MSAIDMHAFSSETRSTISKTASISFFCSLIILTSCVSTGPATNRTLIVRGEWLFDQGEIQDASTLFASATDAVQPPVIRGEGFLGLGRCEIRAGNPDRARTHLQRAATLLDGTARYGEVLYYQGEAFIELHSTRNALETLERAFAYLRDSNLRSRTAYLLQLLYEAANNTDGVARYAPLAKGLELETRELTYWRSKIHPPHDPTPGETFAATPRKPNARESTTAGTDLTLHGRSGWRARNMRRGAVSMGKVRAITIHHTGDASRPSVGTDGDVKTYLRNLQRYAQNTKGWADIGYHFLIDPRGKIWEGRAAKYQGAHAGNPSLNKGNLGIALIGNFQRTRPKPAQLRTLEKLLGNLCKKHRVSLSRVYTHKQSRLSGGLGETDCPGRFLAPLIPKIKRRLLASGTLPASLAGAPDFGSAGDSARSRDGVEALHAGCDRCHPPERTTAD